MPPSDDPTHAPTRVRMPPADRRRQLVGIGLRKFVEQPVQDLSLDEVAAEARVSRGLLFHYFPTKTDFHRAVVEAAGRRVLRNVAPDAGVSGDAAVAQLVERFVAQITRRRASYLALVYGQGPVSLAPDGDTAGTLREEMARLVVATAGLGPWALPTVHGWVAYVEDRALQCVAAATDPVGGGTGDGGDGGDADLVAQCVAALHALTSG